MFGNTSISTDRQSIGLHHLYRALDFLADRKDEIEPALYDRVRDLFRLKLDLVLWDTTLAYFEGRAAEGQAEFGFSKDHRPDRVQIVVGVLMSRDGFPIAHEVFPGNTADLDTFRHTLGKVRERFHLERVILVADRGMVSERLLGEIEAAGLGYIVGVRMRQLKAAEAILARAGRYREVAPNLKVKEVVRGEARYIVCLNPEERERDRRVREEALAKLREKLVAGEARQLIGNSAYRRYLKLDGAGLAVNEAAAQDETRLDGRYVLRTNSSLGAEEVARAYKSLWQVERAFRKLKSGLDLRPAYHWTEKRIRGHVMVCFVALVLEMALRRKVGALDADMPYGDLIVDLSQLKAVEIRPDGRRYLAQTELAGQADLAFRAGGLRPPPHITGMPPARTDPPPECSGNVRLLSLGAHLIPKPPSRQGVKAEVEPLSNVPPREWSGSTDYRYTYGMYASPTRSAAAGSGCVTSLLLVAGTILALAMDLFMRGSDSLSGR